jgi:hypothetical protein
MTHEPGHNGDAVRRRGGDAAAHNQGDGNDSGGRGNREEQLPVMPKRPVSTPPVPPADEHAEEHEGATEEDIGDLGGPGAGYDNEPEQEKDPGGVA